MNAPRPARGEARGAQPEGAPARAALFLDRDGVINVDHGYVHRIEHVAFCDGIFDLVRTARGLGLAVVVVTNQAGIARGYFGEDDFQRLCAWMHVQFAARGAPLDRIYHCPFHPEHDIGAWRVDSPLRKPAPGMLLQAARELRLDLGASWLVGDRETDIEAGRRAGLRTTVLLRPSGADPSAGPAGTRATHVVASLAEAAALLHSAFAGSSVRQGSPP